MQVTVFSSRPHDRTWLAEANRQHGHGLVFLDAALDQHSAALAKGSPGVCAFVNDKLGPDVLGTLKQQGTRVIALRSAGFNHVDLPTADALGLTVLRVPAYSPHAVAEHTVGLMLTLNRKFHRAYARVREHNFSLDGLMGFDMAGKTAGVVGTGKIGQVVAQILKGFGCQVLASDPAPNAECRALGVEYTDLDALLARSDIVTLHAPLTPQTRHVINAQALQRMKRGAMLINTSRGGLVDASKVIQALKSGQLGALGLDVYEEEADLFFRDLSEEVLHDDVFARLLTFPNVLITAHQAFFTREAVSNIAHTTLQNLTDFERGAVTEANRVTAARLSR